MEEGQQNICDMKGEGGITESRKGQRRVSNDMAEREPTEVK